MRKLLANILTQDFGLLARDVTGIKQPVQAVQVDVWEAAQEAALIVSLMVVRGPAEHER